MKLNTNEMAIEILATGKVQVIDTRTAVMSHIWYGQRAGFTSKGAPIKSVASATYTETHVNVDGNEMRRLSRNGTRINGTCIPESGKSVWVVSKLQHADGSFITFAAKVLDERNL